MAGLVAATTYSYRVWAADAAGNQGAYSNVAVATTLSPDTTPPTAPTGLSATAASSVQINLSWTAATDNVGVTGYRVERCQGAGCSNFAQIATPTGTTFSNSGLNAGTSYSYRVRAVDAAGNLGGYSNVASATTLTAPDTTPPTAPTGLSATAVSTSQINLGWTASTDNVGVTGYRLERCQGASCSNFAQIATPAGTTFSDTGRAASTAYRYRVRAVDAAGNLSGYSNIATATTQAADTTAPSAPTGLAATAVSSTQINLTWTASTDNVGVADYRVQRCQGTGCTSWAQVAAPTTDSFNDTGRTASTVYRYRVRARDAAGNLSGFSNIATATTPATPDTTPPSTVSGLSAGAVSGSQINLSWTAATDNVGVTGYRVERCAGAGCSNFAQVLTPTGTSVSDPGLAAGTSYSYRVRAVDAAGNLGGYSNVASATTTAPDTHAAEHGERAERGGGEQQPDQSELDGGDGQRGGDGVSGGAVRGRRLQQLCAGADADGDERERPGAGGGDELQLPGAGGGRGGEPGRVLQRGERDDARRRTRTPPSTVSGLSGGGGEQ